MKKVKRIVKIIGLLVIIFLASLGIGILGVAPIALFKKGMNKNIETKIEQVDEQEKDTDILKIKEIR